MADKKINPEELVDFAVTARKYKTLLTPKYKARKPWTNPSPYFTARIKKINVTAGEHIPKDTLMVELEPAD